MPWRVVFKRVTYPDSKIVIKGKESALDRVDQWMGNIFYYKTPTPEIKKMDYYELKYWSGWCDTYSKAYTDAVNEGGKK